MVYGILLGNVLDRPGVDRRIRSIVNLSMIAALNRLHELELHVKAALKNGLTKDEIKEIFLQGRCVLRSAGWDRQVPCRARGLQGA